MESMTSFKHVGEHLQNAFYQGSPQPDEQDADDQNEVQVIRSRKGHASGDADSAYSEHIP